jgi:hypothetical protein
MNCSNFWTDRIRGFCSAKCWKWPFRIVNDHCPSRGVAVALYTVLWTVVAKYRKWPFSAPHRTKLLNRSKQNFGQLNTSGGQPSWPKFIMIGRVVAAPHIGEIYGWRSFFFADFSGKPTADPALEPHVLYIKRRGFGQQSALRGSHRHLSSLGGVIPEKPLILGPSMRIPSLSDYGCFRHRRNVWRRLIA